MKLLVFSPFYPPHIGGLESHADEFNKHIAKRGVEITVFTPHLPAEAPEEEIIHGNVRVIRFPAWEPMHNYPLPKFWLPAFWSLLAKVSESRPDIIISRTRFFSTSLFALLYAKLRRTPILHIEHGSDYTTFNSSFKTAFGKLYDHIFGWIVLRFADQVIANSTASAAFVEKLSGRDATVIYRGVETEKILAIPNSSPVVIPGLTRDPELPAKNKIVICYIGRLIDGKGVADLLTALAEMKQPDFHCFIVGEGPERTRLETMAKRPKLEGKIKFFGHRNHNETIAIMKSCDIIVNPSYGEGLPTSVTEAALCKKAIIATNVGGTKEIITGNNDGFLIPAGQPDILREKIAYLLDHKEFREQFGEKAYIEIIDKFSWAHASDRYIEVFHSLLDNKKRKS